MQTEKTVKKYMTVYRICIDLAAVLMLLPFSAAAYTAPAPDRQGIWRGSYLSVPTLYYIGIITFALALLAAVLAHLIGDGTFALKGALLTNTCLLAVQRPVTVISAVIEILLITAVVCGVKAKRIRDDGKTVKTA